MVTAISNSTTTTAINPKTTAKANPATARHPLLPSESDNALSPRKPQKITSRYMSSSSSSSSSSSISRRSHSPLLSRTMNSPSMVTTPKPSPTTQSMPKRSFSVERTRPANPRVKSSYFGNGGAAGNTTPPPPTTAAQKMLFTSTRSLAVSFQGESFSIQVSKEKPAPSPNLRKITPERRKPTTPPSKGRSGIPGQTENSRPADQHRWPGRTRRNLMEDVEERKNIGGSELRIPSDNESVSSGSSCEELGHGNSSMVPARFWQEANNRMQQQTDPASPSSRNSGNNIKAMASPKHLNPKRLSLDSPITSPRKVMSSPIRAASPSKLATSSLSSPMRGVSPSRVMSNRLSNVPSILSFVVDVRRGKIGENRIVDAHLLRLLYNKLLQWRFVNARADSSLSAQRLNAEKSLYDAWVATSKIRESVKAKRTELRLLKQHLKLISILKEQITYLEDWALLDRGYSSSLSGAIEALKASTLRLPVVSGAKADVLNVKDAICSAMDVMQAMASSICLLSPKVGHVNSLVVEAANLSAKELVLLDECKDLLSIIAALQVSERSMRTHILQWKCLPQKPNN